MVKCKECETEFEPKNKKGVFCSDKCRQKDYRKSMAKLAKIARDSMVQLPKDFVALKNVHTVTVDEVGVEDFKKIWKPTKNKKADSGAYDGFKGKSFTEEASDAGLRVQVGDDVIQKTENPERLKGESSLDYKVRCIEWKEKQK